MKQQSMLWYMTPCSFVDTVYLISTDSPFRTIREMFIWSGKNSNNRRSMFMSSLALLECLKRVQASITCSRAGQLRPKGGPHNSL